MYIFFIVCYSMYVHALMLELVCFVSNRLIPEEGCRCKKMHNYYQWVAYILVLQVTETFKTKLDF